MPLAFSTTRSINPDQFASVLRACSLGGRRPVDHPDILAAMLENANLLATAWDGHNLVGVARSVTDFAYCCYLSDLAVDERYQNRGIGKELIRQTQARLGDNCKLILLSAPGARDYYPKIGFSRHDSAWVIEARGNIS